MIATPASRCPTATPIWKAVNTQTTTISASAASAPPTAAEEKGIRARTAAA
jgi:hypothetical protein